MDTSNTTSGTSAAQILAQQAANNAAKNTPAGSGSGDNGLAELSGDYSNFLTLLTTQLKNQDPLSPMDTTQFTQQLVQFSAVEQQINGNKKLDQLIGLQSTANAYGAVGFVGTTVAADSDQLPLQGGKAKFDYTIEHSAGAAVLKITNSSGQLVMVKEVDASVGTHPVEWDGTDYVGSQLPDGAYTVAVSYQDLAGKAYEAPITTYGMVDSAEIADGEVSLKLGQVSIPLDQVKTISRPAEATTASQ